jgi:hypothetical protein
MKARLIQVVRFFDIRFMVAFTAMVLACVVFYLVVKSADQRDEAITLLAKKDEISAVERREASVERTLILNQLEELQDKYDTSVKINRDFVAWLRQQGYPVPDRLVLSENVRLETSEERETRQRREAQNQERKRSGGGTTNSGPDRPDSGRGSNGDGRGNGGDRDGDGEKDRGRSDGKSHGGNSGGKGKGRD